MVSPVRLHLSWDVQQLPLLQQAVHGYAVAQGWDEVLEAQINLIAEELVVNAMTHGHEGRSDAADTGWVRVDLQESDGLITMVISDNGVAYDPTQQAPVDIDAPLEARQRGGLGVFLAQELADSLHYGNHGGVNVVTVSKRRGGRP